MSESPEKESLNGLVNQLNLPYSLVSTTDDQRELRRRLAFVRRIQLALHPQAPPPTKILAAKAYLAAYRLHDDVGKTLSYLGGSLESIGDYAYDLKQLAPVVRRAAAAQTDFTYGLVSQVGMQDEFTEEERGYLGKVLQETIKTVKSYVVAAPKSPTTDGSPVLFGEDEYWPDVADTWIAASRVSDDGSVYASAVLPGALAARVRERSDAAVLINVTQLDPKDRISVARNLATELERNSADEKSAITRAFI